MSAASPSTALAHPRNRLNDLPSGEWLRRTKSFWLSAPRSVEASSVADLAAAFTAWLREKAGDEETERLLGQLSESFAYSIAPPRDLLKSKHPATFSEVDIERLITLFTKSGEVVLDPFAGVGSSLIAALRTDRRGVGIELSPEWAQIARERLKIEAERLRAEADDTGQILVGDSGSVLAEFPAESVDYVVTSPPYWAILSKPAGMKMQAERISRGLATDYGVESADLGKVEDYHEFIARLADVLGECARLVRQGRYMSVIVSDFRHGERFYLFHSDLTRAVEARGCVLCGLTVLAQDNKTLYPYGIPYAFVSNVHHQYILTFRKPRPKRVAKPRPMDPSRA